MKPSKPIPRIGQKRLKSLSGKVPYSTIRSSPKPLKKRARSKSEFARVYGSKARVLFVKSLPCAACGVVGYSENAHLLGNGGMSRKADADTIGPLCRERPTMSEELAGLGARFVGCHEQYDRYRWAFDKAHPDFNAAKVAADTEKRWLAHSGGKE